MVEARFSLETFIIIFETVVCITCNVLILLVLFWTNSLRNINKYFFCSLIFSDLLIGLFITPFCIFTSLYRSWIFTDKIFCQIEAYVVAILLIVGIYSIMWINVDHYTAIRKPERYEVLMSPMRSLCWIIFVWAAALSFCGPPLFGPEGAVFHEYTYMCVINTKVQRAYILTTSALVTIPPAIVIFITNCYLFTKSFRKKRDVFDKVFVDRAPRPCNYYINFVISLVFGVTWIPWVFYQFTHAFSDTVIVPPKLQFYLMWLGFTNCFTKFFVYLAMSREFRNGLRQLCIRPEWLCWRQPTTPQAGVHAITIKPGR